MNKENVIKRYIRACENGNVSVETTYTKPSITKISIDRKLLYKTVVEKGDRYTGYRIIAHNISTFTSAVLDLKDKMLLVITKEKMYLYTLSQYEWDLVYNAYLDTKY